MSWIITFSWVTSLLCSWIDWPVEKPDTKSTLTHPKSWLLHCEGRSGITGSCTATLNKVTYGQLRNSNHTKHSQVLVCPESNTSSAWWNIDGKNHVNTSYFSEFNPANVTLMATPEDWIPAVCTRSYHFFYEMDSIMSGTRSGVIAQMTTDSSFPHNFRFRQTWFGTTPVGSSTAGNDTSAD